MMDDDSYIFMENIETLVSKLDPSKPIYMGSENNFVGCDGVKNYGDGPSFAHGGSGILVSRGALKKLVFDVDNCIIKYRDCWAGDVRTMVKKDEGEREK